MTRAAHAYERGLILKGGVGLRCPGRLDSTVALSLWPVVLFLGFCIGLGCSCAPLSGRSGGDSRVPGDSVSNHHVDPTQQCTGAGDVRL